MVILARTFGCEVGSLPFTYLGLPLGRSKPIVEECMQIVHRIQRRLVSGSDFLTQGGKLQLVNSVLSSLPTFYMCTILIPITVIGLWRGSNINGNKPPLAAWSLACKPKQEGGLGIINLKAHNEALLMKNVHKFFNKHDLPWVHLLWEQYYSNGQLPGFRKRGSFWWRDIVKLLDTFKGIARPMVQYGCTIQFWNDLWDGRIYAHNYPELLSFALNKNITLHQVKLSNSLHALFSLPLSIEAYVQYQEMEAHIQQLDLTEKNDGWTYIWGSNIY